MGNLVFTAKYTANTYSLVFDKNASDATGTMDNQTITYDVSTNLSNNLYQREEFDFVNQNTVEDGSGTSYDNGQLVTNLLTDGSITLYAQWVSNITPTYVVKYDANGGEGELPDQTINRNEATALSTNTFTYERYKFVGWNTKSDGTGTSYTDKQEFTNITLESEITLYAIWTDQPVCRRALSLHSEKCTNNSNNNEYCALSGYTVGGTKNTDIITYGSLGDNEHLVLGDAFDCDVDGNNRYDDDERFYYVTDLDADTAVLIYFSNVINGVADNTTSVKNANATKEGPSVGYLNLPTTDQWKNVSLKNPSRTILNEVNTDVTNNGNDTILNPFVYTDRAARYLSLDDFEYI